MNTKLVARRAVVSAAIVACGAFALPAVAGADPIVDDKNPSIDPKTGTSLTAPNKTASFALVDNIAVDYVVVNGKTTQLTNNRWSDLNGLKPGDFWGGKEGLNTVTVVDSSGRQASVTVTLDSIGPNIKVKTESIGINGVYRYLSLKLDDQALVDYIVINGKKKDLTNNQWSDANDLKPGQNGVVEGANTLVAYDALGNSSTFNFVMDTQAPLIVERTQVYNPKQNGRTDVRIVLSEPVKEMPQGWYKVQGSSTVYEKAFYRSGPVAFMLSDIVGNTREEKFNLVLSPAPTVPTTPVSTPPAPSGGSSFGSSES